MRKRTPRSGYCITCGIFREVLHRDHVVPKWCGGLDEESNVQYICANCHQDKTLSEIRSTDYRNYCKKRNKDAWVEGRNTGSTGQRGSDYTCAEKSKEVRAKISISVKEGHRLRREQEALLSPDEKIQLKEKRSERKRADHRRRKERRTALLLQQQSADELKQVH